MTMSILHLIHIPVLILLMERYRVIGGVPVVAMMMIGIVLWLFLLHIVLVEDDDVSCLSSTSLYFDKLYIIYYEFDDHTPDFFLLSLAIQDDLYKMYIYLYETEIKEVCVQKFNDAHSKTLFFTMESASDFFNVLANFVSSTGVNY